VSNSFEISIIFLQINQNQILLSHILLQQSNVVTVLNSLKPLGKSQIFFTLLIISSSSILAYRYSIYFHEMSAKYTPYIVQTIYTALA